MYGPSLVSSEMRCSSSDGLDAYDRYENFVSSNYCKLSYQIDRSQPFSIQSTVHSLDGFTVSRATTVGGKDTLARTRPAISEEGRGRFAVIIPLRGELDLVQFSRSQRCKPGTMAMLSTDDPYVQRKLGDNDTLYFLMPNSFVDQRLLCSEDFCSRQFSIVSGMGQLVRDSVASLQTAASKMTDKEFRSASRMLGDMILVAISGAFDTISDEPSVHAGNLARAKRLIRARLGNSEITIGDIAKQCGISLRYLHKIFHAEGITVSEYIKKERLQKARRMLEIAPGGATVTDICFQCGFSNTSQFSTAFRQAFSISPREVLGSARFQNQQACR